MDDYLGSVKTEQGTITRVKQVKEILEIVLPSGKMDVQLNRSLPSNSG